MTHGIPEISFVIPAFNEQERLPAFLKQVQSYLANVFGDHAYEILVVDDGSSDDTSRVAQEILGAKSVLKLDRNSGKGAAVRRGMLAATGKRRVFADADGATPVAELARLMAALDAGADVAIGSRAAFGGKRVFLCGSAAHPSKGPSVSDSGDSPPKDQVIWNVLPHRHVSGRVFSFLVNALTSLDVCDSQCGFKMMTAQAAERIFSASLVDDFCFDVEMLCLARSFGYQIVEVPVNWSEVAGSKVSMFRDTPRMVASLWNVRRRLGITSSKRLGFVGTCLLTLLLVRLLPLEQETHGLAGKALFFAKVALGFSALVPAFFGWGRLVLGSINTVLAETRIGSGRRPNDPVTIAAQILAGVVVMGVLTFVGGRFFAPGMVSVSAILLPAYFSLLFGWLPKFRPCLSGLRDNWNVLGWGTKSLLLLVSFVFLVRLTPVLSFQGHGDAYIYHLALSEVWLRHGSTGIVLHNIYSGYALAVEHFYLVLKILFRGNAEQNSVAQMVQAIVGFGGMVVALESIGRRFSGQGYKVAMRSVIFLLLLQPRLFSFMTLPKNDALLAGAGMLALAAIVQNQTSVFILMAAFAFVIKPTAAFTFLGISGAVIVCNAPGTPGGRRRMLTISLIGAVAMLLVWIPFGVHAWRLTGNPLFPLLNGVFRSEYAPTSLKDVVLEMKPFSLGVGGYLRSLGTLLTFEPGFVLAAILLLASLVKAFGHFSVVSAVSDVFRDRIFRMVLVFSLLTFFLLETGLGAFGGDISNRHYLTALAPLLTIAGIVLGVAASKARLGRVLVVVLLVWGIGLSNVTVSARSFVRDLASDNLTDSFLEKKPLIRLNAFVGHERDTRVMALTGANSCYFLEHGDFWHRSMTYPMWRWDLEKMEKAEWVSNLHSYGITHMVIEDGEAHRYPALAGLKLDRVTYIKPYTLYKLPESAATVRTER